MHPFSINNNDMYFEIVISAIESVIYLVLYITFTSKTWSLHENRFKYPVFIIFYTMLSFWATTYLPQGIHTIFILLIISIILSFITRTNMYNALITVAAITVYIAIIDTIVSNIFMILLNINLNQLLIDPDLKLKFYLSAKILQIILTVLLFAFNKKKVKISLFKADTNQYSFFILQLLLMSVFIFSINNVISKNKDIFIYNILLAFLYLLSIVLAFFDVKERERLLTTLNKTKNLEEYVNNLQDIVTLIRKEKHDFMNHINTIFAMTKIKKPNSIEMIEKYVTKLTNNLHSSYKFYDTGNMYIDGLFSIKSNICFDNNIELIVDSEVPINLADVDDCDLAGIIGNIINNAIECLVNNPNIVDKKIWLQTLIKVNKFHIKIGNNGPEIHKSHLNRIFENGFTTKENSSDHGFGLYITKQLVSKNGGTILITSNTQKTEFELVFKSRRRSDDDKYIETDDVEQDKTA